MLNSLTVFLAFIAFIIFGYLSLLRLLSKQFLASQPGIMTGLTKCLSDPQLIRNLGSSAFFMSLPATAILLFWGWGPALIWLAVFHFFIESVFQLQYSAQKNGVRIADHLLRSELGPKATLEQALIQIFFLLSMAVIVTLVATLLDRQPGLLFALLFLLPARRLISHPSQAIPLSAKYLGALGLLGLGLAFSDQLGFSVYGDWAPLGSAVPWLVFNMPTLISAILVVAVFNLETNQGFKQDLSLFAGAIILLLVGAMVIKLAWLRPVLDAPLNVGDVKSESLPALIGLSFFLFTGFATFLIRVLNEEESQNNDLTEKNEDNLGSENNKRYTQLQGSSLIHTLYLSLLIISLAAALGIGAWKTHFIEWSNALDILKYLNLAISSTLNLIYTNASSGALLHTILLAALCFTGFSFLLMCANQLTLEEADTETVFSIIIEAKIPQAIGIFLVSAYFIDTGISLYVWLLIGVLAWVLFCQLIISMCLDSKQGILFPLMTLLVVIIGLFQSVMLLINWFSTGEYGLSLLLIIILASALSLWLPDLPALIKKISREEKSDFL